jgi:hypothetical protein
LWGINLAIRRREADFTCNPRLSRDEISCEGLPLCIKPLTFEQPDQVASPKRVRRGPDPPPTNM